MRTIKNVLSQWHRWLLWLLLSFLFWTWIFTLLTDTTPDRKVTLYAQVAECRDRELALRLEEAKPEGLKMVKAHAFSYAMFDTADLESADLYIFHASELEKHLESLAPLDGETLGGGREVWRTSDGQCYGIKIYDAASDRGAAQEYLRYDPGEDCYLCLNAASLHLESGDGAALPIAEALLQLN